ncbi:MAG: hypothetical protein ACI83B_003394 [Sediminicola sp.]|jgi:hypothetical protein
MVMNYTKNQHVLSQWVLRNFRSDDTSAHNKDKQRVWCHTVYHSEDKNDIKEIPLPISSVAICKDLFKLTCPVSGSHFDIESELSDYERDTSILFNELVHGHSFEKLLNIEGKPCALEIMQNFMVIQMILGLNNPQNKMDGKDDIFPPMLEDMIENFENITNLILNPPENVKKHFEEPIFKKMVKVVTASSDVYDKCRALFTLSMLAEAKYLPSLFGYLGRLRNTMFDKFYITGIYHTGYDFNSTELRPVFTICPSVFIINTSNNLNFLPLAHNLAISFSIGKHEYYNSTLDVYSVSPEKMKVRSSDEINIFRVSHDYMDNISTWINMGNIGQTNTMYTPYELKDVESYLKHQEKNKDYHYNPSEPQLVAI